MEKTNTFTWRPVYMAYATTVMSIVSLFFTGIYEAAYTNFLQQSGVDIISEITLYKTVLFILDISLMVIAFSKLPNEDERVEKIRNYALKNVFMLSMLTAAIVGLVINSNMSMLLYVAFIVSYYILMFRLALYRDPEFVYMTDDELRLYGQSNKRYNWFAIIELSLITSAANIIGDKYHQPQLVWTIILVNVYVLALIKTVYFSFKG